MGYVSYTTELNNEGLKDYQLRVRITTADANRIKKYCAKRKISMGEFVRLACDYYLTEKGASSSNKK